MLRQTVVLEEFMAALLLFVGVCALFGILNLFEYKRLD